MPKASTATSARIPKAPGSRGINERRPTISSAVAVAMSCLPGQARAGCATRWATPSVTASATYLRHRQSMRANHRRLWQRVALNRGGAAIHTRQEEEEAQPRGATSAGRGGAVAADVITPIHRREVLVAGPTDVRGPDAAVGRRRVSSPERSRIYRELRSNRVAGQTRFGRRTDDVGQWGRQEQPGVGQHHPINSAATGRKPSPVTRPTMRPGCPAADAAAQYSSKYSSKSSSSSECSSESSS